MSNIIVATTSEGLCARMVKFISREKPRHTVKHARSVKHFRTLLKENRVELVLMEGCFMHGATAYFIYELTNRRRRLRIGVISAEPTSEKKMLRFYTAGAVGFVDLRVTDEKVIEFLKPIVHGAEDRFHKILEARGKADVPSCYSDVLTPREMQLALLTADGLGVDEIAELWGIEEATVRNKRSSIYAKLHVKNSAEITNLMYSMGYKDPEKIHEWEERFDDSAD